MNRDAAGILPLRGDGRLLHDRQDTCARCFLTCCKTGLQTLCHYFLRGGKLRIFKGIALFRDNAPRPVPIEL